MTLHYKLRWQSHFKVKSISAKKAFFSALRCLSVSWGKTRSNVRMIYSSIFEPTLLYGCSLWAPLLGTQLGRQAQRPVLLSITKAFYTSSTESLLILSDLLPLDIRISELATKRQMLYNARQIPFSDTTRKWLLNKRMRSQ